jgi:hypothetical protein
MIVTGIDMTAFLRFSVFVLLFCLGRVCLAQEVTVRVINATNGRPLQKQPVSVSFLYDKKYDKSIPANHARGLNLETDVNGEAHFSFPEPAPVHFSAEVHVDSSRWNCGCGILGSTDNLITKGMVTATTDLSKSASLRPVPAQILIVVRPLSFLERLIYPITKE